MVEKGSKKNGMKKMGTSIKKVIMDNRMMLIYALGAFLALLVGLTFVAGVYFSSHPEAADETIVDQVWWPWIIGGLVLVAAIILFTLPYGKEFPAWRVGIMGVLIVVAGSLATWWYVIHDWLFPVV